MRSQSVHALELVKVRTWFDDLGQLALRQATRGTGPVQGVTADPSWHGATLATGRQPEQGRPRLTADPIRAHRGYSQPTH